MSEVRIEIVSNKLINTRTSRDGARTSNFLSVPMGDSFVSLPLYDDQIVPVVYNGRKSTRYSRIKLGEADKIRRANAYDRATSEVKPVFLTNAQIVELFQESRECYLASRNAEQDREEYIDEDEYEDEYEYEYEDDYGYDNGYDDNFDGLSYGSSCDYDVDNYFYCNTDMEDDYFRQTGRLFSDLPG